MPPAVLFPTDPLNMELSRFMLQSRNLLMQVQNLLLQGQRLFWKNPVYTPQQVFDALGASSVGVVTAAENLCLLVDIVTGVPYTIVPVGLGYVKNVDGTVTVTSSAK